MLTGIRGLLSGASVSRVRQEEHVGAEKHAIANTLCTTATDDECLLVDDGRLQLRFYPIQLNHSNVSGICKLSLKV